MNTMTGGHFLLVICIVAMINGLIRCYRHTEKNPPRKTDAEFVMRPCFHGCGNRVLTVRQAAPHVVVCPEFRAGWLQTQQGDR